MSGRANQPPTLRDPSPPRALSQRATSHRGWAFADGHSTTANRYVHAAGRGTWRVARCALRALRALRLRMFHVKHSYADNERASEPAPDPPRPPPTPRALSQRATSHRGWAFADGLSTAANHCVHAAACPFRIVSNQLTACCAFRRTPRHADSSPQRMRRRMFHVKHSYVDKAGRR